jgi:hypothetical protein
MRDARKKIASSPLWLGTQAGSPQHDGSAGVKARPIAKFSFSHDWIVLGSILVSRAEFGVAPKRSFFGFR